MLQGGKGPRRLQAHHTVGNMPNMPLCVAGGQSWGADDTEATEDRAGVGAVEEWQGSDVTRPLLGELQRGVCTGGRMQVTQPLREMLQGPAGVTVAWSSTVKWRRSEVWGRLCQQPHNTTK